MIKEETEDVNVDIRCSDRSLTSFVRKILAQIQVLNRSVDSRASSLSLIGALSEDEEYEVEDVLNSSRLKAGPPVIFNKSLADLSGRSPCSTTSTRSSYGRNEEDPERFHASLFARLQQVSKRAEETWCFAREQSIVAESVRQRSRSRSRRQTQSSEGSGYTSQ
ncbi:unnamed protein product [Phytophthora lilii]|uniref:Unnamed protein product n=1 Tax=Phytophthora lilii TaxID=2077276 RepID=A0A9W6WMX8_9STRA|nr:unnamed protein product [Phytophthora lilii]